MTSKKHGNLFKMPKEHSLLHYVAVDLDSRIGTVRVFDKLFKIRQNVMSHRPTVGKVVMKDCKILCLATKECMDQLSSYCTLWNTLYNLKSRFVRLNITRLVILKIEYSRGELNRRTVLNVLQNTSAFFPAATTSKGGI